MGKWALQCKYVNVVLYWSPFMTHRIIIHWIKMTPRSSSMPHLQFENQAQRSVWEDLHQLNITVRRSQYAPFLLRIHAWNYLGTICTTGILLSKADLFAWMPYWSWWSCSSFFYSTLLCLISLLSGWLNIDDHNLFCPQEETIWQIKITQVQRISRSKGKINLIFTRNRFTDGFPKGWGLSAKLGKHSAIWGKLGTALQAYTLNPCTKFPPNPTSRKVNT